MLYSKEDKLGRVVGLCYLSPQHLVRDDLELVDLMLDGRVVLLYSTVKGGIIR